MIRSLLVITLFSLTLSSCSWLGLSKDSSAENGAKSISNQNDEEIDLFAESQLTDETILDPRATKEVRKKSPKSEKRTKDTPIVENAKQRETASVGKDDELAMLEEESLAPAPLKVKSAKHGKAPKKSKSKVAYVAPIKTAKPKKEGRGVKLVGGLSEYTSQSGDTMMLIAFNVYGDYRMWHKIARANPSIESGMPIAAGTAIKYPTPEKQFVWSPEGKPYMILTGDTLGRISKKVYGTRKDWKLIYDNNRPLIRDPNLIFAGFTLYYKEKNDKFAFVEPNF